MNDNAEQATGSEETVTESVGVEVESGRNRLPCRGCTRSCTDYAICEGKPWRLVE